MSDLSLGRKNLFKILRRQPAPVDEEILDKHNTRLRERARRKIQHLKDRRRAKIGGVSTGEIARLAPGGLKRTQHPKTVRQPDGRTTVLKSGDNNGKIGGEVLVGWLKGAKVFSLTLEERATCPVSCPLWRGCYGNGMEKVHRFKHGPKLVHKIAEELSELCAKHDRVLIRLHILGDFWHIAYARFWAEMLRIYPNLYIFGFTAHPRDTEIGAEIARIREANPRRFWMRHSGTAGEWGAFTVLAQLTEKTIGDAVVCPEQLDANKGSPGRKHCGSCGACWSTSRPIAFIAHG